MGGLYARQATVKEIDLFLEERDNQLFFANELSLHFDNEIIMIRGVGFSELQSYFSLPFHEMAIVGDVAVFR